MKKLIFFSVACLMALVSCDKEQEIVLPDPTGAEFEAEVIAGSQLEITSANFVEGVKFYLGEKELQATVATTGAVVLVPYALGEFELSAVQNEVKYVLGKVTVKVKVTACPTEVEAGSDLIVTGVGFDVNAALKIGETVLETTYLDGELTATVPETLVEGTYVLYVVQENTSAVIANALTVVLPAPTVYAIKTYSFGHVYGGQFGAMMQFAIEYNEDGTVKSIAETSQGTGMAFTKVDNGYEASSMMLGSSWTYVMEDGRVTKIVVADEEYPWEYDEDGHLVSYSDPCSEATLTWVDGNVVHPACEYAEDKTINLNQTATDYLLIAAPILDMMMESDEPLVSGNPYFFIFAELLGWTGVPSVNYPNMFDGDQGPIAFTLDDNGCPIAADFLGMFGLRYEYLGVE